MRRLILAFILMTAPAFAGGLGDMTDAERSAFRAEIRQYLLDNPKVLTEAMAVLQDRQDKAAALADSKAVTDNSDAIYKDAASFVGGNPNGDITLVEFMDYRCTYCRKAYAEVADLVKTDGNIRFVVKEFPILGDDSVTSSRFAIAMRMLHGDAAYAATHDALITLRGQPDADTLSRLALSLGYDPAPIMALMTDDKVTAVIAANHDLANTLNITGTPTFVIAGKMLRGYVPEDSMKELVIEGRAG